MVHVASLVAACLFAGSAGVLVGIFVCLFAVRKAANEKVALEKKIDALTGEIHKVYEDHGRIAEIVRCLPRIVIRLSQRQRFESMPFTAVRAFREFLGAKRVAYLVPVEGTEEFVVMEATGCPADWRGTLRVSGESGIVGAAARDGVVVARDDMAARPGAARSQFDDSMGPADYAIPIAGIERLFGMIVVGGCTVPPPAERPLVATLADITGSAFQHALVRDAVERKEAADPLTGLPNRQSFLVRLELELRRARNYRIPLSLVLLDVDNMRKINDKWGHAAGDVVIGMAADVIRSATRSTDVTARCGGKEFAVLMLTAAKEAAFTHADRLREAIALGEFRPQGVGEAVKLTVSGGVATYPEDGESAEALIRAAGEALGNAARSGPNRVLRARATA